MFVDILNRTLDTESAKLLGNLRDERLPAKIETSNIQKYVPVFLLVVLEYYHLLPRILISLLVVANISLLITGQDLFF